MTVKPGASSLPITASDAIPGRSLLWLIIGFFLLLTPQWDRLPGWLLAACGILAGWRWLVQEGRLRLPGKLLRYTVMFALVAAYIVTVRGQFTVDTAASFFVIAVGLKWLETRTARDFYVLFFILTYLAAVNFLFEQGILWALINFTAMVLLLLGLQILNAPDLPNALMTGWKRLGGMFIKSLPIVVLLFLFFPRLAPLWSVPLVSGQAQTGISDTMRPGDISNLAQSSERAFRASFGGPLPLPADRYWRGLILDRLDGDTWRQWQEEPFRRPGRVAVDGGVGELTENQYDVLLDPTGQRWAFALEASDSASSNVYEGEWGLFRFNRPADTPVRYRLARQGHEGRPEPLSSAALQRFTQLPFEGNPRSRRLAQTLREQSSGPRDLVETLLRRFREQPYFYTLRPPEMPEDGIDALLFDAKRGFCAHYAGATTFVLRAAGVPARIVVGYQGGQPGAGGDYLIVRQYDAHAWVEAWLPNEGWVRVDPTAAIAPSRIESGLREAVAEEGSFLENDWASPQRYSDIPLVQWASLQLDKINYQWQRWVVGYQGQSQMDLMSRLPGNIGLKELGYLTAGVVALGLLVAGVVTAWNQRALFSRDPYDRLVGQWRHLLEQSGLALTTGETPAQLAEQVSRHYPQAAPPARAFARLVNNHYYGRPAQPDREVVKRDLARMRRLLVATRKALKQGRGRRSARRADVAE